MKTKILSAVLMLVTGFMEAKEAEVDPSHYEKSFLICINKDANLELTATLTQDLEHQSHALFGVGGTASYNFEGKNYSGANFIKDHMSLRYGSRGSIELTHQTLSELFTPFQLKASYNVYGPYYAYDGSFIFKGTIKTPSGPRLEGQTIPVNCKVLGAVGFMKQQKPNDFEL